MLYGGIIVTVLGAIFHLQGHGIVGPKESFMYQNQDWVTQGIAIIIIGAITIAASVIIKIQRA